MTLREGIGQNDNTHLFGRNQTLAAYAGTYENDMYGKIEVILEDGHLVLHLSSVLVGDLKQWNYDTFYATWRDQATDVRGVSHIVTFTIDARGKVSEMNMDTQVCRYYRGNH